MKNNNILGILNILQNIDIKTVNIRTSYWISRNVRNLSPIAVKFEELRTNIQKDSWFSDFQEAVQKDEKTAKEQFKEQLTAADDEIKDYLETENTDITLFKISIDHLDIPSEHIPALLDFITE